MFNFAKFNLFNVFVFGVFLLCSTFANAQNTVITPNVDIIFDIDWTLTYDVSNHYVGADRIFVQNKYYRPADGAPEVLFALSQMPGIRISFFSGENAARNEEILKSIMLPDGKTAFQIAHRILSTPDLTATGVVSRSLSKKFTKDLNKVDPHLDLNNAVIVEDIKDFVPLNQRQNVLWLGATYNFVENYEAKNLIPATKFNPPSRRQWSLERNKLIWALGMITSALKKSQTPSSPFVEALRMQQTNSASLFRSRDQETSPEYYERGLSAINKLIPGYVPLVSFVEISSCLDDVEKVANLSNPFLAASF